MYFYTKKKKNTTLSTSTRNLLNYDSQIMKDKL